MTADRLKQIAIGLGALIFLWGAVEIFGGRFDESASDFALPAVSAVDADSIVLSRADDTLTIVKRAADDWLVNGYLAADASVNEFFGALEEAPRGQLIAENSASHERLEIENGTARSVQVYGGAGSLVHLLVGKQGRSFQDTYFRRPGESNVYTVRTRLASYVDRRIDDWRDRSVAAIDPDSVGSVEIGLGRRQYTVRRNDAGWTFSGGQDADSAAVMRFLRAYESLNATGFATPAQHDSVDFDSPDRRAILRNIAGETVLDLAFDSITGAFWVRKDGDSTVFRISTFVVNRLAPPDSTLRAAAQ